MAGETRALTAMNPSDQRRSFADCTASVSATLHTAYEAFARMTPLFTIALLFSSSVLCAGGMAADADLVPPNERVGGKTQREWSVAWWEWAASFEYEDSPIADRVGSKCAAKQAGDVWFLAGTYGTKRTIRTCTVPAGKHLFFPLINYVVMQQPGTNRSCAILQRDAAIMTEGATVLVLNVDGKRFEGLEIHRQASDGCFDVTARAGASANGVLAAANGYYVMLRPLPPGTHTINFGGALPSMLQAVTYTLRVE